MPRIYLVEVQLGKCLNKGAFVLGAQVFFLTPQGGRETLATYGTDFPTPTPTLVPFLGESLEFSGICSIRRN